MKFGVVVFPGSNCDHDAFHAIGHVLQKQILYIRILLNSPFVGFQYNRIGYG